jgi:hypothetical protein
VRADEKLTAFLELESAICAKGFWLQPRTQVRAWITPRRSGGAALNRLIIDLLTHHLNRRRQSDLLYKGKKCGAFQKNESDPLSDGSFEKSHLLVLTPFTFQ